MQTLPLFLFFLLFFVSLSRRHIRCFVECGQPALPVAPLSLTISKRCFSSHRMLIWAQRWSSHERHADLGAVNVCGMGLSAA